MNYSLVASCLVISTCLASSELKKAKLDTGAYISAILEDRYDDVATELERGIPVNAYNNDGSALYLAVRGPQNIRITRLLLEKGADINAGSTSGNYTPLIVSIEQGNQELFELLLEYNADITVATSHGFSPLHVAAQYGRAVMAKILLERGASLNAETKQGATPLLVATEHNHQEVTQLFLAQEEMPHVGNCLRSYSNEDLTTLINRLINFAHPQIIQLIAEKENGN